MDNLKIFPPTKEINALILADLIVIVLSLWIIGFTDINLKIQKHLFDFREQHWLVDRTEPIKKFFFYIGPKIVFGLTVAFCLAGSILGFKKKGNPKFYENRHRFLLTLIGLIFIPLIAGNIKKFTNVYCPANLQVYGGDKPYIKIFDSYPESFKQIKKGQCFPAGHCLTGFTLMILFFALEKKPQRILGLLSGITLGWIMGFYQMAKGAHFFGDTLISMLTAFLLAAILTTIYNARLQKICD